MISGEELAAYAAGEADPALVARIESALPGDPALAGRLAAIHDVDAQLADWDAPQLDRAGADRLSAAVDADLASLADATGAMAASAAGTDGDTAESGARAGGVEAAGGRPVIVSGWARVRARWADLVDGVGATQLAGAAAALVVVVGVGVVVAGGMGGANDSAGTAEMMDDLAAAEAPEVAGDAGGGFASPRTEAGATSEAMTESAAAGPALSEDAAADGGAESEPQSYAAPGAVPIIDDGRVVADLDDIDPAALRERLEPLVDLTVPTDAGAEPAPDDEASRSASTLLSDGRVSGADLDAVTACRPDGAESAIVAEVVVLSPDRDVVLYVLPDRVVVVAVDGCRRLAVRDG